MLLPPGRPVWQTGGMLNRRTALLGATILPVAGLGFNITGVIPSPIEGGDGNQEFLLGAQLV